MIAYKRWRNPELRAETHFVVQSDENQSTDNEICTITSRPESGRGESASSSGFNNTGGDSEPQVTFTVDDALEAIGFGKFQWKISLLTGLSWQLGDSMEMMLLSILGPQLHCEWKLPSFMVAIITSMFWALGAMFEVLLALLIMPTLGWRWLVGLSTLPMAVFICLCYWLPESPRFNVLSGNKEKALATLAQIAKDNGTAMPQGTLADHTQNGRGQFKDLFIPQYRRTTLLLWFIWLPLTILIFIARAFISGGYQVAFVYTPEVYPTENRALGVGTCSAMARVGALITPFVAQVMLRTSVRLALSFYCGFCLLAGVASLLLPIETLGRVLQETNLDQEPEGEQTTATTSQLNGRTEQDRKGAPPPPGLWSQVLLDESLTRHFLPGDRDNLSGASSHILLFHLLPSLLFSSSSASSSAALHQGCSPPTMALVTLQRSPTPSAASSASTTNSSAGEDFGSDDDRKNNQSARMNDGIVAECCIGRADCRCEEEIGSRNREDRAAAGEEELGEFRAEMERKLREEKRKDLPDWDHDERSEICC
ncbi:Synaptic vesicle 2-related protein [Collichthys lucidus]|uniref:Synaptic vesicle 2-related protein n=1 Tax=Collichthys lucidus TaxID=240159 RepID=A0A4U5V9P3_COLLU|nr:Synaptic vesicle 2-related protein [Collichthys lucidus]